MEKNPAIRNFSAGGGLAWPAGLAVLPTLSLPSTLRFPQEREKVLELTPKRMVNVYYFSYSQSILSDVCVNIEHSVSILK